VKSYLGAIDQGTTSTRFMVFDHAARIVAVAQKEHEQAKEVPTGVTPRFPSSDRFWPAHSPVCCCVLSRFSLALAARDTPPRFRQHSHFSQG
jgi:glycerol kinase